MRVSVTALESRRRDLAAAYAKATRRHARASTLSRQLVHATCEVLRAELRAAKATEAVEDLFSRLAARP